MYYPLSQIITNLYTNGGEYVLLNTKQPYKGYYWKTSQEKIFTGKTPQDTPIEELIIISEDTFNSSENSTVVSYYNRIDDDSINYLNLTKQPPPPLPPPAARSGCRPTRRPPWTPPCPPAWPRRPPPPRPSCSRR